ncbi:hypothetical protein BCV72DRAFT_244311 [Rhizopus microsporus var. microsporus]|uniref:N-acetyltransferase domain-containing protein n=2 Tax=Rhizopus microsporus TaxID=58291 RepID=A0A2G4T8G3_RHIZD|nr:uncharacterized protein RHIMIDRAFT_232731 [Rhizopus microsporus ATCC 52813]ORE03524.1 hypothetical protein BCV72DRAFT_244311 [Rhizopus microsporus var. microsporus]PHZ17299.1 hypothetical protein RHIMIDRAFT_232731 [Rhizopus microsporus ATCC 52813]
MSSAYGRIPKPQGTSDLSAILPIKKILRNGIEGYIQQVDPNNKPLVDYLHSRFNKEIEDGSTYPQENTLNVQEFRDYFLGYDAFVMSKDGIIEPQVDYDWTDKVIGMFYIKPNYPGRCSHICNGGFFVMDHYRGVGAGVAMGEAFKTLVPAIGYKASLFNLVFENNPGSIAIWKKLGFQQVGRIPNAGRLKNSPDKLVDALMFYYDFTQ